MRTFIFGGSFNPVHTGHLFIVQEVMYQLGYERAILVPANIASHKENHTTITPQERLEMLHAAVDDIPGCIVEECDIKRGGITYSIDTIHYILEHYDITGKLGFIIGDDLLPGFGTWKKPDEIKKLVDLIVVHRNAEECIESKYPDFYIKNKMLPISSTEIRERVKKGYPIKYLVPEKVREIIEQRSFYR
ncbi:MAG: nicotinate (nicotinamide) nucleotide adenylyltransferase [Spirochaetia bacterium]|nr:nicotinate (nicotinamide) nucleotide adenylyltransferase [Spirochaetia bacterium]